MPAVLGRFIDTNEPAVIGDLERRMGLYVLGRSGHGKTSFLINIINQDIRTRHGVFFLDPGGDAIENVICRSDLSERVDDIIILDPEKESHSFSINLLACSDVSSDRDRQETYRRAYKVFYDLLQKTQEFGVYLQSSLRHTINAFIESPGFTVAEWPLFLTNSGFRNHLIGNMNYEWMTAAFWRGEFAAKSQTDKEVYLRPLLNRITELLSHRYIRHIVGQSKTTIDFSRLIEERSFLCAFHRLSRLI